MWGMGVVSGSMNTFTRWTLIMGRVKGYVDLLADSRYVIYSLIYSVYMVIH